MSTVDVVLLAAGQTLAIYLFLIVALRSIGRRLLAQPTVFDYLIIAVLGSSVESALYAGSSALAAGLSAAATLLVVNRLLTILAGRVPLVRRLIIGVPVVLVTGGQFLPQELRRAELTPDDVMEAIRLRGYGSLDEVEYAVLEVDGAIGIIPSQGGKDR